MSLKVRYSLRARHEEIELLEHIVHKFGKQKAKEVFDRIEKVLGGISKFPEMYKSSKRKKGLRKCVFSEQTSMYYRLHEGYIGVVSFRPNHKSPKSFKV